MANTALRYNTPIIIIVILSTSLGAFTDTLSPRDRFSTCSQQCATYRRPHAAIGEFNSTCFCADGYHFSEHSKTKGCKADGE